ncbi:MAG: thioredoxin family protein [Thermodesulfovibrionales bacterium]
MKALSLVMVFFLSSFSFLFAADKDYAGLIKWLSLKDGKERARLEKKPMIIDFAVAEGCPRCEAMQRNVYSRKEIADRINKEFIPVRIDLAKELSAEERKLGEEYDFKNDCLLLFLDPDGRILKDPSGKRLCFMDAIDTEVFLRYLDYIKGLSSKKI